MSVAFSTNPKFAILRRENSIDFEGTELMTAHAPTETEMAGSIEAVQAGVMAGTTVKLLFSMPGMSLAHAWFKSGFPLPRHTHNVDCLYYIVAGSLKIGTEELGAGDSFFVGADVPYTYTPGDAGVEVLEFRSSNSFDIRMFADNKAFWDRTLQRTKDKNEAWAGETPPSGLSFGSN